MSKKKKALFSQLHLSMLFVVEVIVLKFIFNSKLQNFEVALKQRDGIITQLTSNLQQAREEKDEIMKEFLALTEQSQKLQIQFQQVRKYIFFVPVLFILCFYLIFLFVFFFTSYA